MPLKDLWRLSTRQMGINSFKSMNLLEDSEQFFPVSAQASDEVLDEQRAGNSPQ